MRLGCLLLLVGVSVDSVAHIEFKSSALLSSPTMALGQLDSSWSDPQKGDYAQGRIRLETSFQLSKSIQFGLQKRADYLMGFNEQTTKFYSALENNQVSNGAYSLSLDLNAALSNSFFIGYEYRLSSRSKMTLRSHLIQGERLQQGRLIGEGIVTDDNVGYNWDLQYIYDENRIFDQSRYPVSGWGYSFDLNYEYRHSNSSTITLQFEDLLYNVYWQQVKQDNGCLSRPIKANCAVHTKKGAFKQTLPAYMSIKWSHQLNDVLQAEVSVEHWSKYSAYATGLKYDHILFSYGWQNKTYNLGYESEYLRVKWGFDQFNYHGANQWQILFDVTWPIYDL